MTGRARRRGGARWRVGEGNRRGESGVVIGRRVGEPPVRAHRRRQSAPSIQVERVEAIRSRGERELYTRIHTYIYIYTSLRTGNSTQSRERRSLTRCITGTMAARRVYRSEQKQQQCRISCRRRDHCRRSVVVRRVPLAESQPRALAETSRPSYLACGYAGTRGSSSRCAH